LIIYSAPGGIKEGYQKSDKAVHVLKEIAKASKVSHDTVAKVKYIEQKADEKQKKDLSLQKFSINKIYTELKKAENRKRIASNLRRIKRRINPSQRKELLRRLKMARAVRMRNKPNIQGFVKSRADKIMRSRVIRKGKISPEQRRELLRRLKMARAVRMRQLKKRRYFKTYCEGKAG
jgi:glutamyl-tRNA reductase